MKLLYAILIIFAIGCQKETLEPGPCALEGFGTIRVNNGSAEKYQVTISLLNASATVDGGGWTEFEEVPAGYYRVDFVSQSTGGGGFLNIEVEECATSLVPIL